MTDSEDDTRRRLEHGHKVLVEARQLVEALAAKTPPELAAQIRETFEFRVSLTDETDRGAALMAAAFLDDRLAAMLAAHLVDNKKVSSRAFDFNGPLGTFSARIDFSYLLGLLPNNARRDLHLVRSIRNKFAHVASALTFDDPSIKSLCDSLVFHGVRNETEPGAKFRRSVMGLLAFVLEVTHSTDRIEERKDFVIPDHTDHYKVVSEIWANVTGGLPYPVAHHHEPVADTPPEKPKAPDGD